MITTARLPSLLGRDRSLPAQRADVLVSCLCIHTRGAVARTTYCAASGLDRPS